MSNGGALPHNIVTDILTRLPVKSLCRFKCVSPSWNSLISSPHFVKTHLNRTEAKNPKHFDHNIILVYAATYQKHLDHNIIHYRSDLILYSVNLTTEVPIATILDLPSLQPSENKGVEVLCSCNGLLLLSDKNNSNFFLSNPSTRECKKLSSLPYSVLDLVDGSYLYAFGVGYDSSTDDYKVVMVSKENIELNIFEPESFPWGPNDTLIVAVYSLKTDDWRRIQDINYTPSIIARSRVFLNGCLHCICRRDLYTVIVAFDLSDEIFREVPLPASFHSHAYELSFSKLAVLAGCLCLVDRGNSKIRVWMMKEYGVRELWTEFMIGPIPGMSPECLLGLLAEDQFLLSPNVHREEKLVVYAPKKETLRDMVVSGIPPNLFTLEAGAHSIRAPVERCISHLFAFGATYVESLVSPHHGRGIGRR